MLTIKNEKGNLAFNTPKTHNLEEYFCNEPHLIKKVIFLVHQINYYSTNGNKGYSFHFNNHREFFNIKSSELTCIIDTLINRNVIKQSSSAVRAVNAAQYSMVQPFNFKNSLESITHNFNLHTDTAITFLHKWLADDGIVKSKKHSAYVKKAKVTSPKNSLQLHSRIKQLEQFISLNGLEIPHALMMPEVTSIHPSTLQAEPVLIDENHSSDSDENSDTNEFEIALAYQLKYNTSVLPSKSDREFLDEMNEEDDDNSSIAYEEDGFIIEGVHALLNEVNSRAMPDTETFKDEKSGSEYRISNYKEFMKDVTCYSAAVRREASGDIFFTMQITTGDNFKCKIGGDLFAFSVNRESEIPVIKYLRKKVNMHY